MLRTERGGFAAPAQSTATDSLSVGARWSMAAISVGVTSSSFLFINGVAFLIPALVAGRGTSLVQAGLLASMPSWGMVVTLFFWGYLTDRLGERIVMTVGSALTAAAGVCRRIGAFAYGHGRIPVPGWHGRRQL